MLDRLDIFKGDLNLIQQIGLASVMAREVDEQIDLEKFRALNTGLATNPATSKDFILNMLKQEQEEEIYDTDPEWITPRSIAEIEDFLRTNAL